MKKLTLITINGRSVFALCPCNDGGQPLVTLGQALAAVNKANPDAQIPEGACIRVGY